MTEQHGKPQNNHDRAVKGREEEHHPETPHDLTKKDGVVSERQDVVIELNCPMFFPVIK